MKKLTYAAITAVAVCALATTPAMAQSSGSTPPDGTNPGSGSSSPTDQAGSQPGDEGVTGTGPRGTPRQEGSTAGSHAHDQEGHAGMTKGAAFDRAFIEKAVAGGLAEVELGKLASGQAQSGDVKRFAEMMVSDHSKANSELMQMAEAQQAKAPSSLRPKDQAFYDRLAKMSGDEFDRAYMAHMVEDHQKDVAEFKKASAAASDPSLKQFASATLPILQKHLQDARTIHAKVGGGAKGTSGQQ